VLTSTGPATGSTSPVALLDAALREWRRNGGPFAPAELARLDALEEFPVAACRALDDFGLPAYYVPVPHGGALSDFPQVVHMLRAVARLDLTVAIAHGKTFLGAVSVWVAGDRQTAAGLGRRIAEGAVVCWGLTERDHGSDLLAGELVARPGPGGWRLDGEKWLINNATRSRFACVLARTAPGGGPRGFSLLLLDKQEATAGRVRHLDKVRTHGIRGADISGLGFEGARFPSATLVGAAGHGGEIVLKAIQLTRTACTALSLGAGDHAIHLATRFARQRRLYGRRLAELPLARDLIGRATARLLLAEAVTLAATRAAHVVPEQMSVMSAVAKAFVPTVVQEAIDQVAELLGARGYLTEVFEHGEFAKLERDHRLVAIFDGSTFVNRQQLISQFPRLGRGYGDADPTVADRLRPLAGGPLPELSFGSLRLASPSGCALALAVPGLLARVRELSAGPGPGPGLHRLLEDFETAAADVHAAAARHRVTSGPAPAEAFLLAERYELVVAGAACLLIVAGQAGQTGQTRAWTVLRACLELVTGMLTPGRAGDDTPFAVLADHVLTEPRPPTLFPSDPGARPW
jgi:alkylation response protein AidB-like acyl-CoA dehydrogenase